MPHGSPKRQVTAPRHPCSRASRAGSLLRLTGGRGSPDPERLRGCVRPLPEGTPPHRPPPLQPSDRTLLQPVSLAPADCAREKKIQSFMAVAPEAQQSMRVRWSAKGDSIDLLWILQVTMSFCACKLIVAVRASRVSARAGTTACCVSGQTRVTECARIFNIISINFWIKFVPR